MKSKGMANCGGSVKPSRSYNMGGMVAKKKKPAYNMGGMASNKKKMPSGSAKGNMNIKSS